MDDRGGAAGFEGKKQGIACVGKYVLVAGPEEKNSKNIRWENTDMIIYAKTPFILMINYYE